jgi:hypothetical protein
MLDNGEPSNTSGLTHPKGGNVNHRLSLKIAYVGRGPESSHAILKNVPITAGSLHVLLLRVTEPAQHARERPIEETRGCHADTVLYTA